jgi:polysaccharide biosynthesis protein PslG
VLPHALARTAARCLAVAVLVLALLVPDAVSVSAATGSAHPQSAHSSAKKKRRHARKKRKHRRRCLRYRRVRVKRHHRTVRVRRCVRWAHRHHKKKASSPAAPAPAPGAGSGSLPVKGGLIWGLNSVNPDDASLANVAGAGVSMARVVMHWADVEPSPGTFKWSGYDWVIGEEARHGITMLPNLLDDPSWASSSWNAVPTNPAAFADFTAHAVARYGPGGTFWRANPSIPYHPATYWEIWNEAWWYMFNSNAATPATYAALVKATAIAGRAANPNAKFLIDADLTAYPTPSTQVEWIDAMYRAVPDLNNYFDGISIHPYSFPRSPDVYSGPGDRWSFKRIGDIRAKFVAHGAADKGFWITELGWPTCPSLPSKCVNEADQAAYLARALQLVKSDYASFMQAVFIYNYKDPSSQNPSSTEDWFGLVRPDGSPKPAWTVFKQATGAG